MTSVQSQPGPLPFSFDQSVAPATSRWVPPRWMLDHASGANTPRQPELNGLGEPWDPRKPVFRGIDLTKPDPRLSIPNLDIDDGVDDSSVIAFLDVSILDSSGKVPYPGDVLVVGNRITSVGRKLSESELAGARVVKGNGRTLMSGLVDAHTHFSWVNAASLDGLATMPVEEHTLFSMRSARTMLDCGYTMTLGAAAAKERLDIVIRDAINKGDIIGPRYLANAQEMAPADGALVAGITAFVETVDDVVANINRIADMGVNQVKLSMSGEEITEHLRAEDTTFTDEMVAAAVEAAHARGLRVCSHARSDESILQCLQYGVDIIYHASFISDSTMVALEAQKDRVFVAPGINWLIGTLEDAEAFGYPPSKAESVGYARELEVGIAGLKEMRKRGIRVLPGGDYGFAWTPHGTYRDLEHFVHRLGFSPMEAIRAGTTLGGELMLHPEELGKVAQGYYADLLLVNGDPTQDIKLLSDHHNLDMVLINGRIHKENDKDHPLAYESVSAGHRFPGPQKREA